jgi:hypothetical protein
MPWAEQSSVFASAEMEARSWSAGAGGGRVLFDDGALRITRAGGQPWLVVAGPCTSASRAPGRIEDSTAPRAARCRSRVQPASRLPGLAAMRCLAVAANLQSRSSLAMLAGLTPPHSPARSRSLH